MTTRLRFRSAPALALVLLACTSPAPEGAITNPPAPGANPVDDLPILVGAISPPPPGSPRPSAAASLASPRPTAQLPTPSPNPTPTPQLLEGEHFFYRMLPSWKVAANDLKPPRLDVEAQYGPGRLQLSAEAQNPNLTLDRKQSELRTSLGEGVVAQQSISLDGVRGFLITANVERPEGKRFLALRGFYYRSQFWKLEATWDKRSPQAAQIERDVDAMLKGFGWL